MNITFFFLLFCICESFTAGFHKSTCCITRLSRSSSSSLSYGHFAGEKTSDTGKSYSFVQDHMRKVAMGLHTRDQAPKEGKEKAQTPFTKWEPSRRDYMQFLVDSLEVYKTLEKIVSNVPFLYFRMTCGIGPHSFSSPESPVHM